MDNTNINIRLFSWHLQLEIGKWFPVITYNSYHKEYNYPDGYFKIYNFFGYTQDKD